MSRRRQVVMRYGIFLSLAGVAGVTIGMGQPPRWAAPTAPAVADTGDMVTDAVEVRQVAVDAFATAFGLAVRDGGLLTDELRSLINGEHVLTPDIQSASDVQFLLKALSDPSLHEQTDPWRQAGEMLPRDGWRTFLSYKDLRRLPERTDPGDTTPDNLVKNHFTDQKMMAKNVEGRFYGFMVPVLHKDQLDEGYLRLQGARVYLSAARGQLAAPTSGVAAAVVRVWQGELYALEGYTDLLLADLYCSGVPLNTFKAVPLVRLDNTKLPDNEKNYVLGGEFWPRNVAYQRALTHHQVVFQPSSTTAQVYQTALAQFNTALRLAGDSAHVLNLARVGRGRAWLALGQYDSAAAAVRDVPQEFAYKLPAYWGGDPDGYEWVGTIADREGENGLPYLSSGDPRIVVGAIVGDKLENSYRGDWLRLLAPANWLGPTPTTTLASGVEADLIRAEALLHQDGPPKMGYSPATAHPWLLLLDSLRRTVPMPGTGKPDPQLLRSIKADPTTACGRIALLFEERAYWLFLTGHRQGDLRRLVRNYHWPQDHVYPTGSYIVPKGYFGPVGQYGTDVNLPIPPQERANPHFHGCLDRGA